MPQFFYQARKGPQELKQGTVEAETESAAIGKLSRMGYFPISVSLACEARKGRARIGLLKKIGGRDVTAFTLQLANLIESGLTLYRALNILQQQTENKRLKTIIQDIASQVKEGKSFSESLKIYPQVFNNMYVSIVNTGEISGRLEGVLKRLADFGEKQEEIYSKVKTAIAYPIFIATIGIGTIVFLFTFVVPKLVELFEDMGQVLPLPTRMLIAVSDFFLRFWWLLLAAGLFVFFALRRNLFTARGKLGLDAFKLKLPVLGQFFKRVQIASFSRTLGTLLTNGVPVLQAMNSVSQTLENEVYIQEVKRITREIREGATMASAIAKSNHFPVLVANMITVGEESGRLEGALLKVAQAYEKQTDQSIKLVTSASKAQANIFCAP